MRNPAEMEIIEIEVTNACQNTCSNCTRFCGHHQKPFFMDFETFKKAVDSLEGFRGIVGMMGGEPTLHPKFEQFAEYLNSKFKMRGQMGSGRRPVKDFLKYTRAKHNVNRVINKCTGPGLLTSMTANYYKYYELIQDTFTFQSLNDHSNVSYHQPILASRRELGIPDDKWRKLRDKCWIQNYWSASITPKGAFFCEIAGTLDMLFDGPGGWPIEKGWYDIEPERFGEQLKWCEMCGIAIPMFSRNANEGVTDCTPELYEKLKQTGSPLVAKGKVSVFTKENMAQAPAHALEEYEYIEDFSKRMKDAARHLKPAGISVILNREIEGAAFGHNMYKAIRDSEFDWILYVSSEVKETDNDGSNSTEAIRAHYADMFLNPGMLYEINGKTGSLFMFNRIAKSLKWFGGDGVLNSRNFDEFVQAWDTDKRIKTDMGEDSLAIDEAHWRAYTDNDFLTIDVAFKTKLKSEVLGMGGIHEIVVLQTASYFLTRGIIAVLKDIGINVYLITHKRFEDMFDNLLEKSEMYVFDSTSEFNEEILEDELLKIKGRRDIDGVVVPYSVPRVHVVASDGYQRIERCARILGSVISRVNIKRDFVDMDFDIDGEAQSNIWGY